MFTDGMHNMGTKNTPDILDAPVYIFSTASESNHNLLKIIARKSGGEYYSIKNNNYDEHVQSLGKPQFAFLFATVDTNIVTDIFPTIPTRVTGASFKLAGKLDYKALKASKSEFTQITLVSATRSAR